MTQILQISTDKKYNFVPLCLCGKFVSVKSVAIKNKKISVNKR